MSEIAKCPHCKEAPTIFNYYGQGYEKSYACCDVEIHGLRLWNQYAAAMELANKLKELSLCDLNPDHYYLEKQVEAAERRVLEAWK